MEDARVQGVEDFRLQPNALASEAAGGVELAWVGGRWNEAQSDAGFHEVSGAGGRADPVQEEGGPGWR